MMLLIYCFFYRSISKSSHAFLSLVSFFCVIKLRDTESVEKMYLNPFPSCEKKTSLPPFNEVNFKLKNLMSSVKFLIMLYFVKF